MIFQNLVVKGIVKFLKSANIDTLVVEKLNEVTKNELDTLHGVTSNIQDQFVSVSSSLETAELEQTNWKTRVASAINAIPKKNPTGLTKTSALVKFESELKNTQDAIEGATAVAANVLSPKKYVGSNGYLTDGTMPDRTNQPSQWVGYEDIIVQKHPQDPASQVLITITNTRNNYYGFYDNTSAIRADMYLPADKIAYGTRVGRAPSSIVSCGADDTNTVLGTFTGDANATASDILSGKSAYVRGEKISGNIPDNTGVPKAVQWCRNYNGRFEVAVDLGYYGCSWNENSYEYLTYSQVASAIGLTAGKIVKGNTILGIVGTGQTGVDTSDANATAIDIRKSKTAYVNGSKITGAMPELKNYYKPTNEIMGITTRTSYFDSSGDSHSVPSTKYLYIRMGSVGYIASPSTDIMVPASKLGDATASDVLKGKTFTSINGIKVIGSLEKPPYMQDTISNYKTKIQTVTGTFASGVAFGIENSGYMGTKYYTPYNETVAFAFDNLIDKIDIGYFVEIEFGNDMYLYEGGYQKESSPHLVSKMIMSPFNKLNIISYKFSASDSAYSTKYFGLILNTDLNIIQLILAPRVDVASDKVLTSNSVIACRDTSKSHIITMTLYSNR